MEPRIVAWTDASVKDGHGIAVAFHASIFREDGESDYYEDSQYVDQQIVTTKAEYTGCLFATQKLYEKIENIQQFNLTLYCDSKGTVKKIQKEKEDRTLDKALRYYASKFNTFNVLWVGREMNEQADALAKAQLERGNRAND